MNRGAWWAIVHGVTKSHTWLKRLSTHAFWAASKGGHSWDSGCLSVCSQYTCQGPVSFLRVTSSFCHLDITSFAGEFCAHSPPASLLPSRCKFALFVICLSIHPSIMYCVFIILCSFPFKVVDISALHPYPNEALLFFVCTHLLIFKDFSIFYSKYLNF